MNNIFDQALPKDQEALFAVIQQRFFRDSPIIVDIHHEGQKVDGGIITLGCRAGPGINVSNLLHEMSHFVEIDDARIGQPGWGLRYGKYCYIPGCGWYEQHTGKSIRREMRVGVFQYHLGAELGFYADLEAFIEDYADTSRFLPSDALCAFAAEENCYKPCDVVDDGKIVDTKGACVKFLRQLAVGPSFQFSVFQQEWARKNELLRSKERAIEVCSK